MYRIIACGSDMSYNPATGAMRVAISDDIAKIIMGKSEMLPDKLLSWISFVDEDDFSGQQLLKIKEEINELIERQLVTRRDVQDLLQLLQFAFDNNRDVVFTPFWHDDIPLAKF
mgnify:CR=1 FL=1